MTLVSSLLYLLIGAARAADMVQYVPFPVVAGFLGMVGSSILRSAFVVNAGRPMSHPSDLLAFAISQPFELAACVALGLSLVLAKRLPVPNRVLLVAAIGTTLLGFYASKHALGVEARWLREQGWLFEKKAAEPFWSVWSKHALGRVHWLRTFPGLADTVGTCTILTISLVLRVTAVDEYVLLRGDSAGQ